MLINDTTPSISPQILLTHYHLSSQNTPASIRTAYLLCLAKNTEDFHRQIQAYLDDNQLDGTAQLAPLPIQTWFTRHGFDANLWRAAQQISTSAPLLCLYPKEEVEQNGQQIESYLNQQSVHFTPFTEFIAPTVLPDEVRSSFFADFEGVGEYHHILNQEAHKREREKEEREEGERKEPQERQKEKPPENPPHFYAVVDCAKAVSFPSRLETIGRLENLYTGNIGQTLEGQAPYLLEFDPYQQETVAFLQRLFRKSDSKVFSHWAINPVIFIKSRQPFDEVHHHLRKWTHLYDPNSEKWYFFRFYDPLVLNRYLPQLQHHPAQLAALFGVRTDIKENGLTEKNNTTPTNPTPEHIIEAFGLRVEDEFVIFTLNPLPKNTLPAKIELGEVEKKAMETLIVNKFKQQLIELFEQNHPIRFRSFKETHKLAFVNHIYHSALAHQFVHPKDIAFFGHLMLYFGAHWYEDPIYHFITQYLDKGQETIDRRMENITDTFNRSIPQILGENLENSVHMIKTLLNWHETQSPTTLSVSRVVNQIVQTTRPYFSKYVDEKHLLLHIHQSLENAQKQVGITTDYQQSTWILLSLLLGIGFYRDPLIPWAKDILVMNVPLDERMDLLLQMLRKRANKVLIATKENH